MPESEQDTNSEERLLAVESSIADIIDRWGLDFTNTNNPILGEREVEVPLQPTSESPELKGGMTTATEFIFREEIMNRIGNEMDEQEKVILALEMFINVPSAYGTAGDVFYDDGSVNEETFMDALDATFEQAVRSGPTGYDNTTKYLEVLMGSSGADPDVLMETFEQKKQTIGGRFDPLTVANAAKQGFSNVLGRTASKSEEKGFLDMILSLNSSIKSVDLYAQAEQYARTQAPEETKAYGMKQAADRVMSVLGII